MTSKVTSKIKAVTLVTTLVTGFSAVLLHKIHVKRLKVTRVTAFLAIESHWGLLGALWGLLEAS